MTLTDKIGPPESNPKERESNPKERPPERYVVLKRNGELTVIEKRQYLIERVLRKSAELYAVKPPYAL